MFDTVESSSATGGTEAQEFVHLDPSQIVIGSNVRTDLPDAKEFRRSIKERGVLEAVTVYRNDQGKYVCLRGQRRTVEAAAVGTPTGTIPCRVVPQPADADRIGDQMVENIHRAGMREAEIVAGMEQLALLGVSAAQIAKRTSIDRPTVNAALAVSKSEQTRARVEAGDLTLEEAAIFAMFENDPQAVERLERRKRWGHGLEHEAQRLRDEAVEREAYQAEVERLRAEGLPVLSGQGAAEARRALRISRLRTAEGEPIPEEDWPTVPGAAVLLTEEWVYPEDEDDQDDATKTEDDEVPDDYEPENGEPVKVYVPVWVLPDTEAAEEAGYTVPSYGAASSMSSQPEAETEEHAEERRAERRRVIANNKAWASAETVRREWLTGFVARKSAPKGAEALICEAVVLGQNCLYKAMEANHPMLRALLGVGADKNRWDSHTEVEQVATKPSTPKAATMTTLAAVLAAWEDSTGKHTWRNVTAWDTRVLRALTEWGYKPSDVERLLLGEEQADTARANDGAESADTDATHSAT